MTQSWPCWAVHLWTHMIPVHPFAGLHPHLRLFLADFIPLESWTIYIHLIWVLAHGGRLVMFLWAWFCQRNMDCLVPCIVRTPLWWSTKATAPTMQLFWTDVTIIKHSRNVNFQHWYTKVSSILCLKNLLFRINVRHKSLQ